MFSSRQNICATITLGENLAGTAFSAGQLLHLLSSQELQAALPCWGIAQGLIETLSAIERIVHRKTPMRDESFPYIADTFIMFANANLIYQSARIFTSGAAGFVPWSFALSTALDLLANVENLASHVMYAYQKTKENNQLFNEDDKETIAIYVISTIAQLLLTMGWVAVALGIPAGFVLIGIASIPRVCIAVSAYDFRLFGQPKTTEKLDVNTHPHLNANSNYQL